MKFRLLALPLVLGGVLSAQGRGPHGNSLTPPTPEELVQRKVDGLTKFFGLTTDQANQVKGFIIAEQSCLTANSTNLKSAREGLVSAIKTGNPTISIAVGALSSYQGVDEGCRATAAAAIYGGLTPPLTTAQLAKLGNGLGPLLGGGGGPRFGPPPGR
jgi:hypothetical protein